MFPPLAPRIFGLEHGGQIYTILGSSVILSSLGGFALVNVAPDLFSYEQMYLLGTLLSSVNLLILWRFKDKPIK